MFNRKSVVLDENDEIDGLRKQVEPLKVELAGLEQRLTQERQRQAEIKSAYDQACLERAEGTPEIDLSRIRAECEDVSGLILGLEKVIQRKVAELQPIEARYNELREAENERLAGRCGKRSGRDSRTLLNCSLFFAHWE